MNLPVPNFHPKPEPEPAAMVRSVTREDVLWNRPIFKAPPLELHPQAFDVAALVQDLRRVGLSLR